MIAHDGCPGHPLRMDSTDALQESAMITSADINAAIATARPDTDLEFSVPGTQPHARDTYLRINGVAYRRLGRGNYRIRSMGLVIRLHVLRVPEAPDAAFVAAFAP